jgi:uncharacterized protein
MKSLDIIIPTLNEEEFLGSLLNSIAKSIEYVKAKSTNPLSINVILADGGSSDSTENIALKHKVTFLRTEQRGRGNQINEAMQKCFGEFVLILHADHIISENGLFKLIQSLEKKQTSDWGILGHEYNKKSFKMTMVKIANRLRFRILKIAFGDQGMFFRRNILDQKGGFPAQVLMEDVELSLMLKKNPSLRIGTVLTASARRWDKQSFISYSWQTFSVLWAYIIQRKGGANRLSAAKKARKRYEIDVKNHLKDTIGYQQDIICIFAKPPVPGKTKSRLAKVIGDEFAADLSRAMLLDIIEQTKLVQYSKIVLFYPPDSDPSLLKFVGDYPLFKQNGSNLGERLSNAFKFLFSFGASKIVIVGSDCISVSNSDIENAFYFLDKKEAVLKPAIDGGYLLVGLKKYHPELFSKIKWGTSSVLQDTVRKMDNSSIGYELLKKGFDLDRFEDIELIQEFMKDNIRTHTSAILKRKEWLNR